MDYEGKRVFFIPGKRKMVSKGRKGKRGHVFRTKNLFNMTQNGMNCVAEEMI